MKEVITASAFCLLLSSCASHEDTFAEKIKARGDAYNSIASSWAEGEAMIKEGNEIVASGKEEYNKGRTLTEEGQSHINKGQAMIEKGQSMKADAEVKYNDYHTHPAYPAAVAAESK